MKHTGIIGYYHKAWEYFSIIFIEDSRTREKEYFKIDGDLDSKEFKDKINELKNLYPDFNLVEFRY